MSGKLPCKLNIRLWNIDKIDKRCKNVKSIWDVDLAANGKHITDEKMSNDKELKKMEDHAV